MRSSSKFFLLELKGRSLEELDEMFEARLPTRKFKRHVCTGIGADLTRLQDRIAGGDKEMLNTLKGFDVDVTAETAEAEKHGRWPEVESRCNNMFSRSFICADSV